MGILLGLALLLLVVALRIAQALSGEPRKAFFGKIWAVLVVVFVVCAALFRITDGLL